jgi:hypothetical protein
MTAEMMGESLTTMHAGVAHGQGSWHKSASSCVADTLHDVSKANGAKKKNIRSARCENSVYPYALCVQARAHADLPTICCASGRVGAVHAKPHGDRALVVAFDGALVGADRACHA